MNLKSLRHLAVAVIAALALPFAANAVGTFPGYPAATIPLTGAETLPADTNVVNGTQTELISTAQIFQTPNSLVNSLICGDFGTCPWQRGTGTSADISSTLTYDADRWWNLGAAGSAINVSRQTGASDVPVAYNASLRFQRKSANADLNQICMGQTLESADVYQYQGQTAVLSFSALAGANFSSAASALQVTIATGSGVDGTSAQLAAGTWTNYANTYQANTTISATWTRYTVAVAIPTFATGTTTVKQIGVKFCYTPVGTAGTNDWVELAGITLNKSGMTAANVTSANAPALQRIPVADEVARAQRFYYQITESAAISVIAPCSAVDTTHTNCIIQLPVTMRAAPTGTYTAGFASPTSTTQATLGNCSALASATTVTSTVASFNQILVNCTATTIPAAGIASFLYSNNGSGKMQFSADL